MHQCGVSDALTVTLHRQWFSSTRDFLHGHGAPLACSEQDGLNHPDAGRVVEAHPCGRMVSRIPQPRYQQVGVIKLQEAKS